MGRILLRSFSATAHNGHREGTAYIKVSSLSQAGWTLIKNMSWKQYSALLMPDAGSHGRRTSDLYYIKHALDCVAFCCKKSRYEVWYVFNALDLDGSFTMLTLFWTHYMDLNCVTHVWSMPNRVLIAYNLIWVHIYTPNRVIWDVDKCIIHIP